PQHDPTPPPPRQPARRDGASSDSDSDSGGGATRARPPRLGPTSSPSSKRRWKGRWWIWRSCGGSRARACLTTPPCGLLSGRSGNSPIFFV
uniref:Uncharacterized protein n=1 Tax=Aegilops tauschii subsp. strangulata TaxID=200361 RepID=A0A453BUD6_AEGTS